MRVHARGELPDLHFFAAMPESQQPSVNANRTLDVHGDRRRINDAFARQTDESLRPGERKFDDEGVWHSFACVQIGRGADGVASV